MDSGKSIQDQFVKVHPLFPLDTSIGIVGGGPSGLSAAYALCKLGYTNVTLLEKNKFVGGMCESAEIEGKIYDLGGQVLAENSAPAIFHLAKEIGAETEEISHHKFALINSSTGKYEDMKVVDDYISIISLTLKLQDEAKASGKIGVHAVSTIAPDPAPTFLKNHGFQSVPKSVAYGYTAAGYGYTKDMPYAYIHEFTRTSMAGKIRRFKGGYGSVWQKLCECLPIKVHCNAQVMSIKRRPVGINVDVRDNSGKEQAMEFDKIIISGSFPFYNGKTYKSPSSNIAETARELMDMSELEKELFSKVHTIDYYTTVLKITGLEHIPMGFYYFGEFMDDPTTIGYPVAMQRFYANTNIFLFWSYGNSADIQGSRVTELAVKTVQSMGGKSEKVILQRRFKYFPHVNSEDLKNGFYDKLENELQGQKNTYYVGGLMAFELTERNSSYAMASVCKHFASKSPLPQKPYIKTLFPLKSNPKAWIAKQLEESPGVKFPDLASLNGYLRHWETHNDLQKKTIYTWINDRGQVEGERTYRELYNNANAIAHMLLTSQKPLIKQGDRVLLVYLPGLDFIDAFFGCLAARVIPVPVIPPDPSQRCGQALLHIQNIFKACDPVAILSTFSYHTAIRASSVRNMLMMRGKEKSSPKWPDLVWIHTDSWVKNSKGVPSHRDQADEQSEPNPSDLCFLQFTSGSTGDAKGVMISHGGLVHNVKLMRKRYKSTSKTVLVSWLPQYHDMGLIGGIFTALVSGGSAILFSPTTFIKKPLLWLKTMSKYKATHSAAPNFAYELLVRRLESTKNKDLIFDLSHIVFLMMAAEPVRVKTLKRFIELTQPFGLSQEVIAPGYGLAENCVYVSSAFGKGNPIYVDWQERVCCGYVDTNDQNIDIRIVDPETGIEHDEAGKEGEIWISSPSSGIGYWEKEELSQQTFGNKLQSQNGRKYTRTGDLGRVISGKLFITGRIKDLFIVAGRNIYPSDIEKTVEDSSELLRPGCCAVVGVPLEILLAKGVSISESSDNIGLVVIAEVREEQPCPKSLYDNILTSVAEEHGIIVSSVVLIKPRSISKTSSGKIKRYECLRQFIDGQLDVIKELFSEEKSSTQSMKKPSQNQTAGGVLSTNRETRKQEIINFLKGLLVEQTGVSISNVSITESLVTHGLDSIGVVRAASKLSSFLGVPIGAIDIFTATCIEDLANFAEEILQKSQPEFLTFESHSQEKIQTNFPQSGAEISVYHKLTFWFLQLLALTYMAAILIIPACLSTYTYTSSISVTNFLLKRNSLSQYLIPLACAPFAWILCIFSTCISIAFFGNSFLQPNYALKQHISIWSLDFIKWWALYKTQEVSSKVLATHLRGTVFLNYWFEILGAKIGSSVCLDTVDITEPYLVSIGDGAVIAEGALIQSHEVKNGILSLGPIQIGQNSSIGPYAVIQKGSIVADEAEVMSLQINDSKTKSKIAIRSTYKEEIGGKEPKMPHNTYEALHHLFGIYMIGFLSSLSAVVVYLIYLWLSQSPPSGQIFSFCCIAGAFHWFPFAIVAYTTMFSTSPSSAINFAIIVSVSYLTHGLILGLVTCTLNYTLIRTQFTKKPNIINWFRNRIIISSHLRFGKFMSGTEAFCVYLRLMGAKIGRDCSIRAINPVSNPEMISLGNGVHLGDFSRIISGFYSSDGFITGKIEVQDNSVVGSQGVILPGSVIQRDVILGALSVAPLNSFLHKGGVYVGSQNPVMVKNSMHSLDDRVEEMDMKYKKVLGNLASNLAATTLKVKARYFHRIGASGKGFLRMYEDIPGLPDHKIFQSRKKYPIVIRHSNCLSSDDDARKDPRGAAIKIFSDENGKNNPLLDLTLKTGRGFHARTIGDFATWLVCSVAAREEHVKHAPHVREAMWDSLRCANSYTELHYYSNICRLFRFKDGPDMYVRFKLRPLDKSIGESSGKVEPTGILPPETGTIPRDKNDTRPLLFLDEDFQNRVNSPNKVCYVFQLQLRPVPNDERTKETALDCTKPWDENEYPYIDVGDIVIDETLSKEESEVLEFNPFHRCHEVDVIRATSCSQSASLDHGRSIIYEICQHMRNKKPLPEAWRVFLQQSDVKIDLTGRPMAASLEKKIDEKITLTRKRYQTLWSISGQPLLQTIVPNFVLSLVVFVPLNGVFYFKDKKILALHWVLPVFWVVSGILSSISCALAKWVLVGRNKEGENKMIWGKGVFMDTIWQAIRTVSGEYFMEMTSGSFLFGIWMKLMGSNVKWEEGVYVDSMGALLNPEMVKVEKGGSVEREALLFGHIYEGEGGKVKYGKVEIGENGFVGSRAVAMPGVRVASAGSLGSLSLAMKGETVN